MPRPSNKHKLLDAAETIFAERGVRGASLRAIQAEAGLAVGSAQYHFEDARALLRAVVVRRMGPLMDERTARLEALAERGQVSTRELLDALVRPMLQLLLEEPVAGRNHVRLMRRLLADGDLVDLFLEEWIEPTADMLRMLCDSIPDVPDDVVHFRFELSWTVVIECFGRWTGDSREELEGHVSSALDYLAGAMTAPVSDASALVPQASGGEHWDKRGGPP